MDTPETNIDRLLQARGEVDERLRVHKSSVAVLFTDVVASTEYFDRYGDTDGFAMVDRHAQLGARIVGEFGGRVIKTIGDSIMAEFADPATCVRASVELQHSLYRMNEKLPERDRLQLRIGINFGSCFRQRGDLFGDTVNMAARITKRTGPGQILISSVVHQAIQQDSTLLCRTLGQVTFKGKAEKEEVFEVVWIDVHAYANLRRDTTIAVARGELCAPGLRVQELIHQLEDVTREANTLTSDITVAFNRDKARTRFVAGTIVANRYRIISLLGRGGMGEVYRADDLKLEQEVALKFLPTNINYDGASLARLHQEVRIARQVSHRNVCRIFDIGDSDGAPFLTMEYVDGEDLQSLLGRIGRFPEDRAIRLSRQICAGLSATHEFGILHRDLKPANVMLDAKGRVRIMDFGLATLADSVGAGGTRAGTPAYMAPEQARGEKLTVKTDIYSLGLILYEVFTGERAFQEPISRQTARLPKNPSSIVKDINPQIDRIILNCLQENPSRRPASVLQIMTALPGGDPVQAALEAGETPSPEMVAASGSSESLSPQAAWSLLAVVSLLVALTVFLYAPTRIYNQVKLIQSPQELRERAQQFAKKAGSGGIDVDSASDFEPSWNYLINKFIASGNYSGGLSASVLTFWYRQSPQLMLSRLSSGALTPSEPPLTEPGMIGLRLDGSGRVTHYLEIPPSKVEESESISAPGWGDFLQLAGYGGTHWTPVKPERTPLTYSDSHVAYEATLPDAPGAVMHIEMAALRGRLVSLETRFPWSEKHEFPPAPTSLKLYLGVLLAVFVITVFWSIWLCRRNIVKGRGDRQGALRLGALAFCISLTILILNGHYVPEVEVIFTLILQTSIALLVGAAVWILYLALEPQARRHWPSTMVSWSRVVEGGIRDPLVARDVLIGCAVGVLAAFLDILKARIPTWLGGPKVLSPPFVLFTGMPHAIAHALYGMSLSVFEVLGLFLLVALLRALLRRDWLVYSAIATLVLVVSLQFSWDYWIVRITLGILATVLFPVVLFRFGLIAVITAFYVSSVFNDFPVTFNSSAWYFGTGLLAVLIPAVLALYGFYFSLAGKPLFGTVALDEQ